MTTETKETLGELIEHGAQLIQWWDSIEQSKTAVLRELAEVVVNIRSQFRTEDGSIDWQGHSWEYRQTIGTMYEKAGVPPDSVSNIQASVRYHVGNRLREVVDTTELEQAGLKKTSPRERMLQARNEANAILHALEADTTKGDLKTRRKRYRQMVDAAEALSERLEAIDVNALTKKDASSMLGELRRARAHLETLEEALESRISHPAMQ